MATPRTLIEGSLRLIGAIATGETASAAEASDALSALNEMIESWSNENLVIHTKSVEKFNLVADQAAYTMGSGGDFNTVRPMMIEVVTIEDQAGDVFEIPPLRLLTQKEFADIALKGDTNTYPQAVYISGSYPLDTLTFWPVPSAAHKAVIYSRKVLTSFSSLSETISLPLGYLRALRYNLAIEIAPEYGKPVSAEVAQIANESRANIKRTNIKPSYLGMDDALTGGRKFNILTGE